MAVVAICSSTDILVEKPALSIRKREIDFEARGAVI
jgi:hypothetical protein